MYSPKVERRAKPIDFGGSIDSGIVAVARFFRSRLPVMS
jgi:hypothetical protein